MDKEEISINWAEIWGADGKLAGIIEWNHEENDFLEGESHGTANPNARGFWNKYFMTYQYEFVRTISR